MKRIVKPNNQQAVEKFNANKFVLENFLFRQQLDFVQDPSPFKIAVCSRRAGKTVACAAHLIDTALKNKDSTNLYITLSGTSGKKIIWREFKKLLKNFNLPAKINDLELSIEFPNGAMVYIVGAKDASEIEKFRGLAIKLCYIDECQSFREYIQDLIDDVIAPALMDYAGSLCLIGTPGPTPTGYFHKCATDESNSWSKHKWSFWDNPFIPTMSGMSHQAVLDRELKRRGITDLHNPSIQREWYGRWVLDSDSLVLHYDSSKNDFRDLPTSTYNYILGIDIGFKDADALAVLAYSDSDPTTYLVEEIVTSKQGITELVQQIQSVSKRYDISKMVMDMGGLGKKIGEEMVKRYLIPVEAADKVRKMENLELLDDALRTGKFKAPANSRFTQDSYLVEIDRDKSKPDRLVISNRYHSDIIDAVLYAFKCSPAYAYEPPKPLKPKWGTKEWADQQTESMFEKELEALQKQESHSKWLKNEWD